MSTSNGMVILSRGPDVRMETVSRRTAFFEATEHCHRGAECIEDAQVQCECTAEKEGAPASAPWNETIELRKAKDELNAALAIINALLTTP